MEKETQNTLCRIERRAIEALAVIPVMEVLIERLGQEEALYILRKANEKEAFQRGASLRKQLGQTGIAELVADVATWGAGSSMVVEVLEQTSRTFFFNITRCPFYEKYRELGLVEYGVAFSCCRDEPFARGLNPQLHLERSQTIMEGAALCDFRYTLTDQQG